MYPCNFRYTDQEVVGEECIADEKAQKDYLSSNLHFIMLWSGESFSQNSFGEQSLTKQSKFYTKQIDSSYPQWMEGIPMLNSIEDETDYLQFGQTDEHEFY